MNKVSFTRKELYDLVWSTSMLSLSKKYDISDVGLRKICIRMGIPLPLVGHWEKLKAGKRVKITRLSSEYKGETEITLSLREEGKSSNQKNIAVVELQKQLKSLAGISLIVPGKLTSTDKRILAAKESLTKPGRYTDKGLVYTSRNELDIKVAPVNIGRALRFMDTLIKIVEARGYKVEVSNDTYVMVENEQMKIVLRERLRKVEAKTSWGSQDYVPTGKFYFKLDEYPHKEWKDGRLSLEEQLPAIVARLEIQGKELLDRQLEWKKERLEREEEDRKRRELVARKEEELFNFKKILQASSRWHKAVNLRRYIDSFEEKTKVTKGLSQELTDWLEWARGKADWYDPFIEKQDELLSDVDLETLTFIDQ